MRLTVIGCGHLGAAHAASMAEIGHEVVGVDIDPEKVALLASGKAWFHEPGLDEMLARHTASGRLRFTTSFEEAAAFGDVHFLGVATPGKDGKDEYGNHGTDSTAEAESSEGCTEMGRPRWNSSTGGDRTSFSSGPAPAAAASSPRPASAPRPPRTWRPPGSSRPPPRRPPPRRGS